MNNRATIIIFTIISMAMAALMTMGAGSCHRKNGIAETNSPVKVAPKDNLAVWEDPAADMEVGERPMPDFKSVTIEAKDGAIEIKVEFYGRLAPIFNHVFEDGKIRGMELVKVYIDTDNDPATGTSGEWALGPMGEPIEGYEYKFTFATGYEYIYKDDGTKGAGSGPVILDSNYIEITGIYATGTVSIYGDSGMPAEIMQKTDESPINMKEFSQLSDDSISSRIEYGVMGLKTGDKIRVCYQDNESESGEVSEPKTLVLQ